MPGLRQPGKLGGVSRTTGVNLNIRRRSSFSIDKIFNDNEQVLWFDAEVSTTLFSDPFRTTQSNINGPVVSIENRLDNEK